MTPPTTEDVNEYLRLKEQAKKAINDDIIAQKRLVAHSRLVAATKDINKGYDELYETYQACIYFVAQYRAMFKQPKGLDKKGKRLVQ